MNEMIVIKVEKDDSGEFHAVVLVDGVAEYITGSFGCPGNAYRAARDWLCRVD